MWKSDSLLACKLSNFFGFSFYQTILLSFLNSILAIYKQDRKSNNSIRLLQLIFQSIEHKSNEEKVFVFFFLFFIVITFKNTRTIDISTNVGSNTTQSLLIIDKSHKSHQHQNHSKNKNPIYSCGNKKDEFIQEFISIRNHLKRTTFYL